MNYSVILCTINDKDKAKEIAKVLLELRLAACVNIVDNVCSIYRWQGEICEDGEYLIIIKSRRDLFEELKNKITELHPYEVPEIISLNIEQGSESYIDWLNGQLK